MKDQGIRTHLGANRTKENKAVNRYQHVTYSVMEYIESIDFRPQHFSRIIVTPPRLDPSHTDIKSYLDHWYQAKESVLVMGERIPAALANGCLEYKLIPHLTFDYQWRSKS